MTLKRIQPNTLPFGKALAFDVRDVRGNIVLKAGHIVRRGDLVDHREALEDGLWVIDAENDARAASAAKRKTGTPQVTPDDTPHEATGAHLHSPHPTETKPARGTPHGQPVRGPDANGCESRESFYSQTNAGAGAAAVPGAGGETRAIELTNLIPGVQVPRAIYDRAGRMLLPAGAVLTEEMIAGLREQQVTKVYSRLRAVTPGMTVHERSGRSINRAEAEKEAADRLDKTIDSAQGFASIHTTPRDMTARRLPLKDLRDHINAGTKAVQATVATYAKIAREASNGRTGAIKEAGSLLERLRKFIEADASLPSLLLDLKTTPGEYLFRHGMNTSLLSMTIADQLGFRDDEVTAAGVGAMFSDIGMLQVPDDIRLAPRSLDHEERIEVERHPIYTVDTLERNGMENRVVLLVCYQSHERCNRGGYPRQRHRMFIHPLARITAAADVFAAVTCDRPYRGKLSPYNAMATLLTETKSGRLDNQIVRAFLDRMSLFPVGSYVKLSNNIQARVLRANHGHHTRPVVLPINRDGSESDEEIDLLRVSSLRVVQAIDAPADPKDGTFHSFRPSRRNPKAA